jgi:hypothetical protein
VIVADRALYVVVENGTWRRTFNRHRSRENDFDLLWGPEPLLTRARNSFEIDRWLNPSAMTYVDVDQRELRYFGGEWDDTGLDVRQHQVHHRLVEAAWPGWTVRYAWGGIVEVLDLVDVGRDSVFYRDPRQPDRDAVLQRWSTADDHPMEWTEAVTSVSQGDDVWLVPWHHDLFVTGPVLVDSIVARTPTPLSLPNVFDRGGMHIDLDSHRVDYWLLQDEPLLAEAIVEAWPGWNVEFHGWDHEDQIRRCRGQLRIARRDDDTVLDGLIIGIRDRYSPAETLIDENLRAEQMVGAVPVGSLSLRLSDGRSWPWPASRRNEWLSALLHRAGWVDASDRHRLPTQSIP